MKIAGAAALLMIALLAGCAKEKPPEAVKRFSIHGEVMRLDQQDKLATIRHQKIEGYMEAMTMTFPVKDAQEFSQLQTGNCIDGTVFVQGDSFWVGEIKHLDTPGDHCVAPPAAK